MFQLSKITLFLQKTDELTGIRDHPNQGVRSYRSQGKSAAYPRESLGTMQFNFPYVLRGAVISRSLVLLTGCFAQAEPCQLFRLGLNLPLEQITGWGFKIRNRTLSHRKLFCQASPGCQAGNLFRFSTLYSAKSIIWLLPSLTLISLVWLGIILFGADSCGGFVPGIEGANLSQGHNGCPWINQNFHLKSRCKCLLCLVLPDPCSGDGTLCLLSFKLCSAFPKPRFWLHSHQLFFSEPVNLSASSACISVREASLGSLQKRKWKVESYLRWNVVLCLCWTSLRGLRLQLPEKAGKSCCHPVIQLSSLPRLWTCFAWASYNMHELWFWFRVEASRDIHPTFSCVEVLVGFSTAQCSFEGVCSQENYVCLLVDCFLVIPARSEKIWTDARGMALVLVHASLIPSWKGQQCVVPRVTFGRQNLLSMSPPSPSPIMRASSTCRLLSLVAWSKLGCCVGFPGRNTASTTPQGYVGTYIQLIPFQFRYWKTEDSKPNSLGIFLKNTFF